jgi:hypothetical protein
MLDVRHARLAERQRHDDEKTSQGLPILQKEELVTPTVHSRDPGTSKKKPVISIQDILATSLLLRSGQDVTFIGHTETLHAHSSHLAARSVSLPPDHHFIHAAPGDQVGATPSRITQVLASLQRDVILLRNELNLELWLNLENVKHIGRLYEEHILSRNAEVERQALVCCLASISAA